MDLFDAIKGRRSIRSFKPKSIPEKLLQKILEAGQLAPSAGNLQARDFIVVENQEVRKLLSKAALDQDFIEAAPVNIVVCANKERNAEKYGGRGRRFYCLLDAAAAVENILLAVHALGLGACWIGAFHDDEVAEILNLPRWIKPVAIVPIGYPDETPMRTSRIALDRIVHKNFYEKNFPKR